MTWVVVSGLFLFELIKMKRSPTTKKSSGCVFLLKTDKENRLGNIQVFEDKELVLTHCIQRQSKHDEVHA
jgi:hypothetical protein